VGPERHHRWAPADGTVEVDTAAEFLTAIATSGPLNICVKGMITLPGPMHDVTCDKTIVGIGATSGFTGAGSTWAFPSANSITRRCRPTPCTTSSSAISCFTGTPDDAVNVRCSANHVWIDHNDLSNGFDGLVDIKRGSSYVTVSWNHTHNHTKNMLLGHDDGNAAQDVGNLKVTYHHNWFDQHAAAQPAVRFGEPVHVVNNYFIGNSDVRGGLPGERRLHVEGNYFETVEEPVTNHYAGPTGRCVARNNKFVG
jgi:pectate lyase